MAGIGLIWLTMTVLAIGCTPHSESFLWGSLRPGRYAVGFRSEVSGGVRIDVWYPALQDGKPSMSFGDYVTHELGLDSRSTEAHDWLATSISGSGSGVQTEALDSVLGSGMTARLDAPELEGPFPLVIWSPRLETTPAQSVLAEYLASHGYLRYASGPYGHDH